MRKKNKPQTTVTTGPLFNKDGTVAVDAKRCPSLHRALSRISQEQRQGWARVVEMRRNDEDDAADRLVRKLLGIQGPPMTEERKAELKAWKEEHADEIKERKQQEREVRRRTLAILTTGKTKVKRKA